MTPDPSIDCSVNGDSRAAAATLMVGGPRRAYRGASAEAKLLRRARDGDVAAFEELTRAHCDRLFALALRLVHDRSDAEEVVQETLLRAWRGIERFQGHSSFFTWLYRIGVNEANRSLSARVRRPEPCGLADERPHPDAPPDDGLACQAENRGLLAAVAVAVRALPAGYRTALVLRDIEGLSAREAAQLAGIGEAVLNRRLQLARRMLRATLS